MGGALGQNHQKDLGSNVACVDDTLIHLGVGEELDFTHL